MPHSRPLKTADAKLRLLEEKLNVGTWTWDLPTDEIAWSPGLFRMLGLDPMTVVPTFDLYQSMVHPNDQIFFNNAVGLASNTRLQNKRFRIIRPDGSLRWLHSKAQPHLDRHGNTIVLFGVVVDITDEEKVEADLEVERKVSTIFTKLLKGKVWRAQPNGKLIETADWTRLTGETAAQAHDWNALAAIHPDDRVSFREAWSKAITSQQEYVATIRVRTISGEYVRIASRALPLRDKTGKIEQWIGHSAFVDQTSSLGKAPVILSPGQIRAARGFLAWSAQDLSHRSGVSFSTIRRMEVSTAAVRPERVNCVKETFEKHGLSFTQDDSGRLSVFTQAPT